ncbi:MAG: helix-hairpin-helix domain-containing protein [Candidatus Latescibacteria bacterium]|nr:helix-hairpin-helix domain-containing protein [Candidatus Latescibacterota bacterium]
MYRLILVCALSCPILAAAQEANEIVTHTVDSDDGMTDESDLIRLDWLRQNPIDLNRCNVEELTQLPWITTTQAQALISYRKKHGRFARISKISSVPGLDRSLLNRIKPFVKASKDRDLSSGRWRVVSSQKEDGHQPEPGRMAVQLNASVGTRAKVGLHVDKTPHESELRPKGGYLDISTGGILQRLVVGGYALEYGQGLVLGPSAHRRIDGLGSRVKWRGRGLVASTGSTRGARQTGLAISMGGRQTTGSFFAGRLRAGGSIVGSRIEGRFNDRKLGISAARMTGPDIENVRGTFDFEIPISGLTVFGEVAPFQKGGTELRIGQSWKAGAFDGGLQIGFFNKGLQIRCTVIINRICR